ncbi:PASTA domain-containing protein [Streptomyces sp. SA15]|uniref:PASTA domain-containing protein n=1 Tax=Streptomyces sp. SA15 TaxID=934019 RepID=UPI00211C2970|nr:PASTA domain-containing protein [Streptomyces sp. SA15]
MKAVAAGVPSLAPFFDESVGLGQDARVRSRPAHGGLQRGDTPGLYGGTKKPTICDVERLEQFLTDPGNHKKAQAWAGALDITTERIPDYLDRLTPVLLRHDTLVRNHDYEKEKAVPFNSLLQAGIAILVDEQGLPAVKCSCGNPLRPFEGDTSRISVEFEDGNKKWRGYQRSSVVAVRPAPRTLDRIALVDVVKPDRGINRPVGTTGEDDSTFDTRKRRAVPHLAGTTFGQASRQLADRGLAVSYDGKGLPPDGARVTASDPPAGTELRFGEYVTLSVAGGASEDTIGGSPGGSTGGSTTPPAPPAPSPSGGPGTTPPPSSSSGGPRPSPSGPSGPSSSTAPGSEPPSSNPPPSSDQPPSSPPPDSASEPPPPNSPPSPDPPDELAADRRPGHQQRATAPDQRARHQRPRHQQPGKHRADEQRTRHQWARDRRAHRKRSHVAPP